MSTLRQRSKSAPVALNMLHYTNSDRCGGSNQTFHYLKKSMNGSSMATSSAMAPKRTLLYHIQKKAKKVVPKQCRKLLSRSGKYLDDQSSPSSPDRHHLTAPSPPSTPPRRINSRDVLTQSQTDVVVLSVDERTTISSDLSSEGVEEQNDCEQQDKSTMGPPLPLNVPSKHDDCDDDNDEKQDEVVEDQCQQERVTSSYESFLKPICVHILLVDPPTRQFELVTIPILSLHTTIAHLLSLIPTHSQTIGHLPYFGLTPPKDNDAFPSALDAPVNLTGDELLLAVPEGYTEGDVQRIFSKKLIHHTKLKRALKNKLGKNSEEEWDSLTASPRRNKLERQGMRRVRSAESLSGLGSLHGSDVNSVYTATDVRSTSDAIRSLQDQLNSSKHGPRTNDVIAIVDTIDTTTEEGNVTKTQRICVTTQLNELSLARRTRNKLISWSGMDDLSSMGVFSIAVAMFLQKNGLKWLTSLRPPMTSSTNAASQSSFGPSGILLCWGFFAVLNWYQEQNPVRRTSRLLDGRGERQDDEDDLCQALRY